MGNETSRESLHENDESRERLRDSLVSHDTPTASNEADKLAFPSWMKDDAIEVCMQCEKKFTLLIRKHHCTWRVLCCPWILLIFVFISFIFLFVFVFVFV